ncbi:MAG: hypothetical protein ACU84Q_17335 [Gammaproteobacteria bacterium]
MKKTYVAILIAFLASTLIGHASFANEESNSGLSALTLRGLTSVYVEVDGIHKDFEKYGLVSEQLKSEIEAELNNSGLQISNRHSLMNDPSVARLRIKINANENQYRFYHYGVKLELAQKIPTNEHGGYIAETTWTNGQTGVIMPMDLRRLGVYAKELVSVFLKDYHTQNPKVATTR